MFLCYKKTRRSRDEPFLYLMITYGCEPRDYFNLESATTNCYTYVPFSLLLFWVQIYIFSSFPANFSVTFLIK